MENKKEAIIFIDGNNLYHNLKAMYIKPSDLDFKKFVDYICNYFNCVPKQIIYYNSKPDIREGKTKYYRHMSYMSKIGKIPKISMRLRKLQTSSTFEIQKEKQEMLETLELCEICKPIVKKNREDCIGRIKMKEKGIDAMIIVDMISIAIINNENVFCILVSGDADFVPAMDILKKKNKEVFSASVICGYARNLRKNFPSFAMNRNDIMKNCLE